MSQFADGTFAKGLFASVPKIVTVPAESGFAGAMTFQSILRSPPYDIQVEDGDDGGRMVTVAIARSDDGDRVVSVVCEMVDTPLFDAVYSEFSFGIAVFSLSEQSEAFVTQERQTALPYIPDDIRSEVMNVVCEGLKFLVKDLNPVQVYWVTKDRDPHEKALPKYNMLMETLENMGFSASQEGTDRFSRRFWTMNR
ncbi:MAG TPA: hypothetical protein VF499_16290 [Afipia sp.]